MRELELHGDIETIFSEVKEQLAAELNQPVDTLKAVGLRFVLYDEELDQVYERQASSADFNMRKLIPAITDELGLSQAWNVVVKTMAAVTSILERDNLAHHDSIWFVDNYLEEGLEGLKLALVFEILDVFPEDELEEIKREVQEQIKTLIDAYLTTQKPQPMRDLVRLASRTIQVHIYQKGDEVMEKLIAEMKESNDLMHIT